MLTLEGGETARRRVPESELVYPTKEESDRVKQVVDRLVEARLLVKGQLETGEPYVEAAHDFMVRGWNKLQKWIEEDQENLAIQQRLTPTAMEWYSQQPESHWWNMAPSHWLKLLKKRREQTGLLWNTNPHLDRLKDKVWLNKIEDNFFCHSLNKRIRDTYLLRLLTIGIPLVILLIVIVQLARFTSNWGKHSMHLGKLSEGQFYVYIINNRQETYYKRFRRFAQTIEELNLDTITPNYEYKIDGQEAVVQAIPRIKNLNRFTGKVFIVEGKPSSIICMSKETRDVILTLPYLNSDSSKCGSGFSRKDFTTINDHELNKSEEKWVVLLVEWWRNFEKLLEKMTGN
jgi:hypothetical protein